MFLWHVSRCSIFSMVHQFCPGYWLGTAMKANRSSFQHRQCVLCHVALTTLGKILWMLHTTSSDVVTHSNSSYPSLCSIYVHAKHHGASLSKWWMSQKLEILCCVLLWSCLSLACRVSSANLPHLPVLFCCNVTSLSQACNKYSMHISIWASIKARLPKVCVISWLHYLAATLHR